MRTSRDIGEIVKKVALVAQVIAFNYLYYNNLGVFVSCCVLCLIYFHRTFQSLVNIWRYAGLLLATLLNMMMSFPLKLAQTYISYCKMAVDGNLIIDTNINVFTRDIYTLKSLPKIICLYIIFQVHGSVKWCIWKGPGITY